MKRAKMSCRGTTLVEMLVCALLIGLACAMAMTAVGAGYSRPASFNRSDRLVQAASGLSERLKDYVTDDASPATADRAPAGSWSLPGDACGDCWALAEGRHDATALLPEDLRRRGARLSYTVAPPGSGAAAGSRVLIEAELP